MGYNKFIAATVQFEPKQFEKEYNINVLLRMMEEAAQKGAKLIASPEMGITGYCWYSREEISPYVEAIPGPTTQKFTELAKKYNCYVIIGMPELELETGIYFNSAVLIGPEGVIGTHRKTHVYIAEPKWAAPGDKDHQVFETPIGRIALLICMDIHFIETARLVALRGADIICHISNWLAERTPGLYWITRAFENGFYLIEANRWGLERTVQFSGGSCIIDTDGAILGVIDKGDGIAYGEIDLEKARRKMMDPEGDNLFEDRKPSLYRNMMTNTFLWNPLDFFALYGKSPLPPGKQSGIAVAQFNPTSDKVYNLKRCEELAEEGKSQGAELIIFPELALSGDYNGRESGETIPGPSSDKLIGLSIRHKLHLVAGLVELDGDNLYNTAILTGPEGLIGKYRKIHLCNRDKKWATGGNRWETFDLPCGRVGILIGYDSIIPEAGRVLALLGCDLILCPSALTGPLPKSHPGTAVGLNYPIPVGPDPHHWHLHRVRAGENNVYFAFANVFDPIRGMFGKSGIFGPDLFKFPRDESIVYDGEGIAFLKIDTTNLDSMYPTNVVRRKDLVLMRQPQFYKDIVREKSPR